MKHLVIPDTQCRPGLPDDHLEWAARVALKHRPDVVIQLGDHWDMPSLSSYDSLHGKVAAGVDILADIEAGNAALAKFDAVIKDWNRQRNNRRRYRPRKILLRGNHENRLARAVSDDPMIAGFAREHPFESPGWEVVPFLEPINVDGVSYCHYFPRAANGCVVQSKRGAPSAKAQCIREGGSATAGHKQGLDVHIQCVGGGRRIRGVIAGSFEREPAGYKSPQGQAYWRGLLLKHGVREGDYDLEELSMRRLESEYA